jgi:hypothetical protein
MATIRIRCDNCGGGARNHVILQEYTHRWGNDDACIYGESTYQICQCAGCDSIRYRTESSCSEDQDPDTGEYAITESIYPEELRGDREPISMHELPDSIARIYREVIIAFNAGAFILAGGGLRAIVEALCKDKAVQGKSLKEKINQLVDQQLLASAQADLLHEERYIGNAALHEILAPSKLDVIDGLEIIETLLSTLYVVPDRAKRLRLKRERREAASSTEQQVTEGGSMGYGSIDD